MSTSVLSSTSNWIWTLNLLFDSVHHSRSAALNLNRDYSAEYVVWHLESWRNSVESILSSTWICEIRIANHGQILAELLPEFIIDLKLQIQFLSNWVIHISKWKSELIDLTEFEKYFQFPITNSFTVLSISLMLTAWHLRGYEIIKIIANQFVQGQKC